MHLVRRGDSNGGGESVAQIPVATSPRYSCLHADDFGASQAPKRQRPNAFASNPLPEVMVPQPRDSSTSQLPALIRTASRRLQGVKVLLASLPGVSTESQVLARERAACTIKNCIDATWEPSTVARYNAVLGGAVAEAESLQYLELVAALRQ